jgi:TPR repeat protein
MGFLHATGLWAELNSALPVLYYTFGASSGSAWSQMALGYRYWTGVGVTANCEKALEQYRRVAATVASEGKQKYGISRM